MSDIRARSSNDKYNYYREIGRDFGVKELPDLARFIIDRFGADPRIRVAEIGCGAGHVSGALTSRFPNADIIATDLVEHCLELAKANYPALTVAQVDADGEIPFADGSFDLVVSCNLFEHLHDERHHLAEVFRVLRPGGSYYLTTPHLFFDTVWWGVLFCKTTRWRAVHGRLRHDPRIDHCNLKTLRSLTRSLRVAGFDVSVRHRRHFANTEREKLERLFRRLPAQVRAAACGVLEACWLALPAAMQPTIVAVAHKPCLPCAPR